jgi:hypothetical protein
MQNTLGILYAKHGEKSHAKHTRNITRKTHVEYSKQNTPEITRENINAYKYLAGKIQTTNIYKDRLCGLVVRVLDYRCRGPGFDSRALQQQKK